MTIGSLNRLLLPVGVVALAACASSRTRYAEEERPTFPLKLCGQATQKDCAAYLFPKNSDVAARNTDGFPKRYLELANSTVRTTYCEQAASEPAERQACIDRLDEVSDYFNPGDKVPDADALGVALEGGGSKAAPFDLGVLAGLSEVGLLQNRVGAISSISGGSYAASFYYNRLLDKAEQQEGGSKMEKPEDVGDYDSWFASCIPDYFQSNFQLISARPDQAMPKCGERSPPQVKGYSQFDPKYEFQGHVWQNHDLLRGDTPGNLSTQENWRLPEYANIAWMTTETAVMVPFQFVARTAFRWPMNSSPTKLGYKLGLERQYGYSPHDWAEAGDSNLERMSETLTARRKDRTLAKLAKACTKSDPAAPLWILGTTAPGSISGTDWLEPAPRDPLRQQFEITAFGYGSGTYGYAKRPPDAPFDFLGRNPTGLPILDAVVASAAFLDDDQTQISKQPFRMLAGGLQQFGDLTWFSEIRNFNRPESARVIEHMLPWPLYLTQTVRYRDTPYIHLQDGGNTENSGIFPLLRRGYRTIIYAHATQDTNSAFESICHLKNHLELDGAYFLVSRHLEHKVALRKKQNEAKGDKGKFRTYLDGLCSSQLDGSDLVVFDNNPERAADQRDPAVGRLYCERLGHHLSAGDAPCKEYISNFRKKKTPDPAADTGFVSDDTLFFGWETAGVLRFEVVRGDPLSTEYSDQPPEDKLLSTIIAVVPALSLSDINRQTDLGAHSWSALCSLSPDQRSAIQIKQCNAPGGVSLSSNADRDDQVSGISCTALAHVLRDSCVGDGRGQHPNFPQDSFVWETLHNTYTTYAAYFDLGRHQVRRALCNVDPNICKRNRADAGSGAPLNEADRR
jgi:hypothetical protein